GGFMVVEIRKSSPCPRMRIIAMVTATLLTLPSLILGQATISTGNIQGTVTDPSGAVVVTAKIEITSKETGQGIHLTTTSSGVFVSGALSPGNYVVRVENQGFKTTEVSL